LFRAKGYQDTSVAEIADAAAISERTFFRYFNAKEDILFDIPERFSERVRDAIISEPADVPDWAALERALLSHAEFMESVKDTFLPTGKLFESVPELGARLAVMQRHWALALAEGLAMRRGDPEATHHDLGLAAAAVGVYGMSIRHWVRNPLSSLPQLAREAFVRFVSTVGATRPVSADDSALEPDRAP